MANDQLPANRRPMTAVEQRNADNARKSEVIKDRLKDAIEDQRPSIEAFLAVFGISFDVFNAGLTVFLSKQQREQPEFFVDLHIPSFMEALTRIAMNGLMPDGKEAAIAAYRDRDLGAKVAQAMFMRDGFVKVLWRTGMVKSINDQVVTVKEYEGGRFDYEEGDQGFITHKVDLMRKDSDPVVAAYCVIELVGGGVMREVVPKDELDKMAKMSKSPARQSWAHQMHRKGAIRRIMGKMPRDKAIVQLLQHDDASYDFAKLDAPAEGAPDHKTLFSGKPIRQKKVKAEPLAIEQGADMVVGTAAADLKEGDMVDVQVDFKDGRMEPVPGQVIHKTEEQQVMEDNERDAMGSDEPPFVLRAIITTKNGVQEYEPGPAGAEFWFGDIQQKMKVLDAETLPAFWGKNLQFIQEAGQHGHADYAMKLVTLARDLGLSWEGSHRG